MTSEIVSRKLEIGDRVRARTGWQGWIEGVLIEQRPNANHGLCFGVRPDNQPWYPVLWFSGKDVFCPPVPQNQEDR